MTNRLTLKQRREIVRRFKSGTRISRINGYYREAADDDQIWYPWSSLEIEQVLRDYMNGRLALGPKRKSK